MANKLFKFIVLLTKLCAYSLLFFRKLHDYSNTDTNKNTKNTCNEQKHNYCQMSNSTLTFYLVGYKSVVFSKINIDVYSFISGQKPE